MATEDSADSTPRRRRWPYVLAVVALAVVVFLVTLPLLVDWYATRWLHERGLVDASIEDVDIDLFRGRIGLDGLVLTDEDGRRNRAGRTFLDLTWTGLLRNRVLIGRLELSDAEITVRRDEARDFFIADFLVAAAERETAEEAGGEAEPGFEFGIEEIELRDVTAHYRGQFLVEDVLFDELRVGEIATWSPEVDTPVLIRATIDGRAHRIEGHVRPLAEAPGARLEFALDGLELAPFHAALENSGVADAAGRLSVNGELVAAGGDETAVSFDGSANLADIRLTHNAVALGRSSLGWAGRAEYRSTQAAEEIRLAGRLQGSGLSVALPGASDAAGAAATAREEHGAEQTTDPPGEADRASAPVQGSDDALPAGTDAAPGAADGGEGEPTRGSGSAAATTAPPGGLHLAAETLDLNLDNLVLNLGAEATEVELSGGFALRSPAIEQPDLEARLGTLRWDGEARLRLGDAAPAGTVGGALAAESLAVVGAPGRVTVAGLALEDTRVTLAPDGRTAGLRIATRAAVDGLELDGTAGRAALARVVWSGQADLDLRDAGVAGRIDGELDVDSVRASAVAPTLRVDGGRLGWRGALDLDVGGAGLRADAGRLELENFVLGRTEPAAELVGIDGLATDIGAGADAWVVLEDLGMDGLRLLERPAAAAGEASHVLQVARLELDRLSAATNRTEVGLVGVQGLEAWVEQDAAGPETSRIIGGADAGPDSKLESGSKQESGAKQESGSAKGSTTAATFRLEGFETRAPGTLRFVDRSVRPVVDLRLDGLSVALGPLDSARPDTLTPMELGASIEAYTKLSFGGELAPLADRLTVYGTGRIESLRMPWLAGYQAKTIGYVAHSGSLEADLDVKIEQDLLDSSAELVVRQLELRRVVAPEDDEFTADLGVPMDKALDLLKDENGAIRLTVPIEGDLADLSVGIGDALRTVWAKGLRLGMTQAATTFFAPLLPAIAVSKLVGMANKVRFEPVGFTPGSAELAADQAGYLGEMADILNSRPNVDVVLCGVAVDADRLQALGLPDADEKVADEKVAGEGAAVGAAPSATAAPDSADASLLGLGEARQRAVKAALVELGVSASRLVTCAPEVDADPAGLPRVEIGV